MLTNIPLGKDYNYLPHWQHTTDAMYYGKLSVSLFFLFLFLNESKRNECDPLYDASVV